MTDRNFPKKELQDDLPVKSFISQEQESFKGDKFFYRIVAGGLIVTILTSIIGSILITLYNKDSPPILLSSASAAIGVLSAIFLGGKSK